MLKVDISRCRRRDRVEIEMNGLTNVQVTHPNVSGTLIQLQQDADMSRHGNPDTFSFCSVRREPS